MCQKDPGNTPAYAGKTESTKFSSRNHSETPPLTRGRRRALRTSRTARVKHPRLRGEDHDRSPGSRVLLETPPLTRGRLPHRLSSRRCSRKHPRLRGEDVSVCAACAFCSETPPLTRGRPVGDPPGPDGKRNTPAYAGKTSQQPRRAG